MRSLILHPQLRVAAVGAKSLALQRPEMGILLALASEPVVHGAHVMSQPAIAMAIVVLPRVVAAHVYRLRTRAAKQGFDLRMRKLGNEYLLEAPVEIMRNDIAPTKLDPDDLKLVGQLIEACHDAQLAERAKKRFFGL